MDLSRKLVVEFIGTLIFVFAIGEALVNAGPFAPLAIGTALMVMVFAGGHISGGHFNPAVSTAALVRGKLPSSEFVPYLAAQALGAIVAALIFLGIEDSVEAGAFAGAGTMIVVEFLFTFALCWVVLHTAMAAGTEGNSFYGLAIGFTVLVGAYAVGALSGARSIRRSPWGRRSWASSRGVTSGSTCSRTSRAGSRPRGSSCT